MIYDDGDDDGDSDDDDDEDDDDNDDDDDGDGDALQSGGLFNENESWLSFKSSAPVIFVLRT